MYASPAAFRRTGSSGAVVGDVVVSGIVVVVLVVAAAIVVLIVDGGGVATGLLVSADSSLPLHAARTMVVNTATVTALRIREQ